jgi:hypothetical protein
MRRKMTTKVCLHCGQPFVAFRSNAKFCDPRHRQYHREDQERSLRKVVLEERGHRCEVCKKTEGPMFVRMVNGEPTILCGVHQSAESRRKFYERTGWKPGTPGYVTEKHRLDDGRPPKPDADAGVYAIRNTVNDYELIGSSMRMSRRWDVHLADLRRGIHRNVALQEAWNLYGETCFTFVVIETGHKTPQALKVAEKRLIYTRSAYYNAFPYGHLPI